MLRAYRTPGYPFVLALCIAAFDEYIAYIPAILNILFYILTCLVLYRITVFSKKASVLSVYFVTLCPVDITITSIASVEPLSLFIFTFSYWGFFESTKVPESFLFAFLTGVSAGFGTLVKPTMLLLPALWLYNFMTIKTRASNIAVTAFQY